MPAPTVSVVAIVVLCCSMVGGLVMEMRNGGFERRMSKLSFSRILGPTFSRRFSANVLEYLFT